jgi:site-specific DNA-cytosine methylase
VTGSAKVSGSNAPAAIADPRARDWFPNVLGVTRWDEPTGTVTSQGRATTGAFSVADPRLGCAPRAGAYRVLGWEEAAATITGSLAIDNGPAAVADPRVLGDAVPAAAPLDPDKPPPFTPVIVAADGTWHRPLTTLELAALQGLPLIHNGAPLRLAGSGHTRWREAIGNAIPPPAAQAIAEQLLLALLISKLGAFALSSNEVWVAPPELET